MAFNPISRVDEPALPLFDEAALDIADYLRAEADAEDDIHHDEAKGHGLAALTLGAIGIVYGDIGTSPLYAFREALRATGAVTPGAGEVLGILSLLIWTLILIVTVKYIFFLLRVDNRGEGGILALYTLVRLAAGKRSVPVLMLALGGAALFAGDAAITPAISVLSAVEGAELVLPSLEPFVLPLTVGILIALFLMQRGGTAKIARLFGPICVVWFLTLAGLGLWHVGETPSVLASFNPIWGLVFLFEHTGVAFVVLGAIFLAVTGGEALYADLGHFGRKPIKLAWFGLVLPALVMNYLGQGAMVIAHPERAENSFFELAPEGLLPWLVALATVATVIASQAVISGAFSVARGAIQLGFLPRLTIRHTAEAASGQIYIGMVNWILLFGVLALVLSFQSSAALSSAYGISVTGSMVLETTLAALFLWRAVKIPLVISFLIVSPVLLVETTFFASNAMKFMDGGYVPVLIACGMALIMWAWWRGSQKVLMRVHKMAISVKSLVKSMRNSSVHVIPGTAFFLTPDSGIVPSALLHNLKHNRVLHEQTVFLTVETLRVPFATAEERVTVEPLGGCFIRLILRFGFMETPLMDRIYVALSRLAADPTDFYHFPGALTHRASKGAQ
jgi:KUP system potassium uptake protein